MRNGKRTLFGFMIAFLVTLCVAIAVVFLVFFGNDGNDGDNVNRRAPRNRNITETIRIENNGWRRALEKPDGAEFWHYYPAIPSDIAPGTAVVLSASADRFVAWEADSNHADVEFFDQVLDGDMVLATFIMPEYDVMIRALYEDPPAPGNEHTGEMFIYSSEPSEYGAAPMPMSVGAITLPDGMVGVGYSNFISAPYPNGTTWQIMDPLNLPAGLGTPSGTISGDITGPNIVLLTGTPTAAGMSTFNIWFENPDLPIPINEIIPVSIRIWERPAVTTSSLPDGMVGVDYNAGLSFSVPEYTTPVWSVAPSSLLPLPDVLSIDPGSGIISGLPASAAIGTNSFTLRLTTTTTTPTTPTPIVVDIDIPVTITVWDRAVITTPPGALLDGIVSGPYNALGNQELTATIPAGLRWDWEVVGNLPNGLSLNYPAFPVSPSPANISGTPITAGTFPFNVQLRASDPAGLQVLPSDFVSEPVSMTIEILPLPEIKEVDPVTGEPIDTVGTIILGPLMVGTLLDLRPGEPPDTPFSQTFIAVGIPVGTSWDLSIWDLSIPALVSLPDALSISTTTLTYDNPAFTISGTPEEAGTFNFTIILTANGSTKPNMDGAETERDFSVKIWERRYLNATLVPPMVSPYVHRVSEIPPPSGEPLFRAIMPETTGYVTVSLPGIVFMRWEVLTGNASIGNNYRIDKRQDVGDAVLDIAYVWITMPDADVTIRATPADDPSITPAPPVGSPDGTPAVLPDGTVGIPYQGGLRIINRADLGDMSLGPRRELWSIVSGSMPPGIPGTTLVLDESTGFILGTPTAAGTYTFTAGLTLPGSMRIDRLFSITIEPGLQVMVGNVDRSADGVNLADLVLLARFVRGEPGINIDLEAGNIVTTPPAEPQMPDPEALAGWFADPAYSNPLITTDIGEFRDRVNP